MNAAVPDFEETVFDYAARVRGPVGGRYPVAIAGPAHGLDIGHPVLGRRVIQAVGECPVISAERNLKNTLRNSYLRVRTDGEAQRRLRNVLRE
jgi:hypothetical protein